MKVHRSPRCRAFTLVEVLIVIVIIVLIAGLVLSLTRRAMKSAKATMDAGNLHQVGLALNVHVTELGYFPVGIDQGNSTSWQDLVVKQQVGDDSKVTQIPMLWSPLLVSAIPENLNRQAISHFAANPAVMDQSDTDASGEAVPKFKLRISQLTRPSEQILLCGAVAKSANAEYHESHPVLWDMAGLIGGPARDGLPPQLDPADANQAIRFPDDLGKNQSFGAMPDFFRYGGGKGQFFFADGHIEAMLPADHREKNWAVSY